jgi:hypothetical protein
MVSFEVTPCNEKVHHFGFAAARCHFDHKPEPFCIKHAC